jgi:hypothetical protein
LFCFLQCFQASPLLLFFQVSNWFFFTPLSTFLGILHSRHKETLQLGPRGALGFLGPKVFFSLPNFSQEGFLETFSSFGISLVFFFPCKDLLSAKTFWVVLFGIQGLAHFAIITGLSP